MEDILLLIILSIDFHSSPTKFCDGAKMETFLRSVFSASRVQCISDLHSKFALRPHHVPKYGNVQSPTAEIRREKKN